MARFVIFKVGERQGPLAYLNALGHFAPDTSDPKIFGSSTEADEAIRITGADGKFDLDAFTRRTEPEPCESTVYIG